MDKYISVTDILSSRVTIKLAELCLLKSLKATKSTQNPYIARGLQLT